MNHTRILACEHEWLPVDDRRIATLLRKAGYQRVLCLRCWCELDRRA